MDFIVACSIRNDTEDLKALSAVLLSKLRQPGHLDPARTTPGGPEINKDGLSLVIGKRDLFLVEGHDRKSRRRIPRQRFGGWHGVIRGLRRRLRSDGLAAKWFPSDEDKEQSEER